MAETKRQRYTKLLSSLKNERSSFESHWRDIASFIKPRRLRLSRSDVNRGDKRNQNIIDSTATQASSVLRAGMMSGMTSPSRPWFRFGTQDPDLAKFGPVKEWLETTRSTLASGLLRSNFYNAAPILYGDGGDFATGAMGMFDDDKDIFRFTPFPLGEYWIANDHKLRVRTFVREFPMTVRQVVPMFANGRDLSVLSPTVRQAWEQGNYEQKVDVCHVIQPNAEHDPRYLSAKFLPFTDCYFEIGRDEGSDTFLRESGFDEFPVMVARWETAAGDVYGTDCPGMKALGDVKQLQLGEKISASAIDKMVRPPMIAPAAFRNTKLSQLPGEISYADEGANMTIRPMIDTSRFRVDYLEQKQAVIRDRIDEAYFKPLFSLISNIDDPKNVTATAINEMKEEKLMQLGPVFGQYDEDFLKPTIDRGFAMLHRAGMLPEAPPELEGHVLEVEYISAMAIALKAIGRQGVDVFTGYALNLAGAVPSVLDKLDTDAMIEGYADMTGVPPNMVVPADKVAQIRQAKAEAMQAQQTAESLSTASQAAKNLSETSLDGNTALNAVVGANG